MADFQKMKELREQIRLLIEEKPELQALQDELDNKLKGVKDHKERARIIQEMLLNTWYRITDIGF